MLGERGNCRQILADKPIIWRALRPIWLHGHVLAGALHEDGDSIQAATQAKPDDGVHVADQRVLMVVAPEPSIGKHTWTVEALVEVGQ